MKDRTVWTTEFNESRVKLLNEVSHIQVKSVGTYAATFITICESVGEKRTFIIT